MQKKSHIGQFFSLIPIFCSSCDSLSSSSWWKWWSWQWHGKWSWWWKKM